jgi:hypothetical protein
MNSKLILRYLTIICFVLVLCPQLFAAPPPPPGVPIDGGISFLIVAAVGYGASKMSKEEKI